MKMNNKNFLRAVASLGLSSVLMVGCVSPDNYQQEKNTNNQNDEQSEQEQEQDEEEYEFDIDKKKRKKYYATPNTTAPTTSTVIKGSSGIGSKKGGASS